MLSPFGHAKKPADSSCFRRNHQPAFLTSLFFRFYLIYPVMWGLKAFCPRIPGLLRMMRSRNPHPIIRTSWGIFVASTAMYSRPGRVTSRSPPTFSTTVVRVIFQVSITSIRYL